MQPIYTGEPFEREAMDIIKPIPKTDGGNRYILTVINTLQNTSRHTHWQTKKPRHVGFLDQKATDQKARMFLNEFVSCFGVLYCCTLIKAQTSNQICFKSFVKCLISRRRKLLHTTRNAMDK